MKNTIDSALHAEGLEQSWPCCEGHGNSCVGLWHGLDPHLVHEKVRCIADGPLVGEAGDACLGAGL